MTSDVPGFSSRRALFTLVCSRMASVLVRSCIEIGKSLRPNLQARQVSGRFDYLRGI